MASYNQVYEIENAIERELPLVMQDEVKDLVENAIESATALVYAYSPQYNSRRMWSGGLADRKTYDANYYPSEKELVVEVKTPWQNKGFRWIDGSGTKGNELADVIEKNRVYHAPKRPFLKEADKIVKSRRRQIEEVIADHLNKTV